MAKYKVGDKVWIADTFDDSDYQPRLVEITEVMEPASNGEIVYEVVCKLDRKFYNTCYTGRGESKIYETEEEAKVAAKKETEDRERRNYTESALQAFDDGNIVFDTEEGLFYSPIEEFVKQPLEGMLYDLNRNEATLRTEARESKDWRWVNDMAMMKLLEYYYNKAHEKDTSACL